MKVSSVRLGHANNSSSTHSILLYSTAPPIRSGEGFEFGWDWFHLRGEADKLKYLAALLYSSISNNMSSEHALIVIKELTGIDLREAKDEHSESGFRAYVDHQSVLSFPVEFGREARHGGVKYNHQFMKEFVDYVAKNPHVTIRGGNDNTGPEGVPAFDGRPSKINRMPSDGARPPIARKDGDWWILYNPDTGAKVRLSFVDDTAEYLRATRPELVDIKITDYCPYDCSFCYQSSTKEGKHAPKSYIDDLAYSMAQAEVFEVALGGGETTAHPQFPDILRTFAKSWGITPNFTTFNMDWAKKKEIAEAVREHCRSFAVSSPTQVKALKAWNRVQGHGGVEGTLQIPMGCYSKAVVTKAIKEAQELHVPVTLLGFKHFGRGETFQVKDYSWVLDLFVDSKPYARFGADTLFVEQFGPKLKELGVSEKLMVGKEGQFSCYIDAVNKVMGASSYTKDLHPVNEKRDKLFSHFPYAA